jgi:hypothetical protein
MLYKILLFLGVILLVWIGIRIIVRSHPTVFDKSGIRAMKNGSGARPIIHGRDGWQSAILFGIFSLLPQLIPAIAKKEQSKILKKELGQFRARKKRIKEPFKHLLPLEAVIDETAEDFLDQVREQGFDFIPLRLKIQKTRKKFPEFAELYKKTDDLLATCFELLIQAGERAETDDDLVTLSEIEADFNDYKASRFDFGDMTSLLELYDKLLEEEVTLRDYLAGSSSGGSSNSGTSSKGPRKNYYDILGIQPSATSNEIKSAYRKMAKKYHPDVKTAEMNKVSDPDVRAQIEKAFDEKFQNVNEAYQILKDAQQRADYDKTL